jgi:hypothetical protein
MDAHALDAVTKLTCPDTRMSSDKTGGSTFAT